MSVEAIADVNARFMEAFLRQDARVVARLYTENGSLLPPGGDFFTGHDDIESFWREAMNAGIAAVNLESIETEILGDTAVDVGRYTLSGSDSSVLDRGKYMVVFKKQSGAWKLHRDIWNSNQAR